MFFVSVTVVFNWVSGWKLPAPLDGLVLLGLLVSGM